MPVDVVLHIYHHEHGHGTAVGELIRAKEPRRHVVVWPDEDAFRAGIGEAEVLFTSSSPPREHWAEARRLRLVQMMGVGVEDLLPAPNLRSDVAIAGLRGVFANEVAEHVFAMTLALVRGLPAIVTRQRAHEWRPFASGTLAGKTIGILGRGAIGKRVASIAEAFGMKVITFSRQSGDDSSHDSSHDRDEVMRVADVLVVCLPRTPQTIGLVDRPALGLLPHGALVVNVGRGGIVDEQALMDALMRGDIGGVALDVFDEEPLPRTSAWWTTAPNAIITPHIAGLGLQYMDRAVDVLLENVRRLEANEALIHLVDREAGY